MEESRRYEATVAFFVTKNGELALPEIELVSRAKTGV